MNEIQEFNKKYREQGGFSTLSELKFCCVPQTFIAKHFGVSKEAVRLWIKKFFKEEYDPRDDRRQIVINGMVEFAKKHTREEFMQAYGKKSPQFLEVALSEIEKLEIWS